MVEGEMPWARAGGTAATRNKAETNPIHTQIEPNLGLLQGENVELGELFGSTLGPETVFDEKVRLGYNLRRWCTRRIEFSCILNGVNMLADITVADLLRPCEKRQAAFYDFAVIVGGSLLIGLCAQIKIQPFGPVPITGQTFAVLMIGALLGARRGALAVLAYLAQGLAGLPVFAMASGPAALLGPTGGYLAGFVPAAYVTGLLAEKGWDRRFGTTVLAMVLGNIAIYASGLFWLCCLTGISKTIVTAGLLPFIPGDILKILLAAVMLPSAWRLIARSSS